MDTQAVFPTGMFSAGIEPVGIILHQFYTISYLFQDFIYIHNYNKSNRLFLLPPYTLSYFDVMRLIINVEAFFFQIRGTQNEDLLLF